MPFFYRENGNRGGGGKTSDGAVKLFNSNIFPFFKNKDKVNIINEDAFKYLEKNSAKYDYIFADLWHLPEDGLPLYSRLLKLDAMKNTKCSYWIENEMKVISSPGLYD